MGPLPRRQIRVVCDHIVDVAVGWPHLEQASRVSGVGGSEVQVGSPHPEYVEQLGRDGALELRHSFSS